jgi:predicted DNA-binding transcriptional regulator YafY
MYTIPPKKMLILNILDILKKYSDADHRLSQKQIIDKLDKEYSMTVDRKAVKNNLMNLIDFGYDIGYTETPRQGKDGEEAPILSDWYLIREFSDAELRLLIDSLLFSKAIPYKQCEKLVGKLEGLSSTFFQAKVKHIRNMPENMPANPQLFYTIEILDEAISKHQRVSFHYTSIDIDKKPHPRMGDDGKPREYVIDPYQMLATNGRYYLVCSNVRHPGVVNYRVDRIADIQLLEDKATILREHIDPSYYMAEHVYMFSGESVRVKFRADRAIVGDIIDWFGRDVKFSEASDSKVVVTVRVNESAMLHWAMQYGMYVEVLEPAGLRAKVKAAAEQMAGRYVE